MKLPGSAIRLILFLLLPASMIAQGIGYRDLTDNAFRDSTMSARRGGGGCSGASHSRLDPRIETVTATIIALDKTSYGIGEEVTFEIRIANSGASTISIPWTPHLRDLEPSDPRTSYHYRDGVVSLLFKDSRGAESYIFEHLYGSSSNSGTLRELAPGHWFTVRGRKRIDADDLWGKQDFIDSGFVQAKVTASYRQDKGTYISKDGGSFDTWCMPLTCLAANEVDVRIEPR